MPVQSISIPGLEADLEKQPETTTLPSQNEGGSNVIEYSPSTKLLNKRVLITGGDSGIGRAVALLFALEKARHIVIQHLEPEKKDAEKTKELIEKLSKGSCKCTLIEHRLNGQQDNAKRLVDKAVEAFGDGGMDVLINNAAYQEQVEQFEDLSASQIHETFNVNIISMMLITQAALPYMKAGSTIVNTASVNHYKGHPTLVDYSTTKGAIVAFTRSLSNQLVERGIRINAVAPGPIHTPLISATMNKESRETFGQDVPMKRPGQPVEVATCFVFLAGPDSSYMSGQTLHPNGGVIVNS
jgi:NAD(P)-dependent dehydrogenase (short-subunit alcohol dehydrogenase family)